MKNPWRAMPILVLLLAPRVCEAHSFDRIIDLYTYTDSQQAVRVHSFARAELLTDGGARVYDGTSAADFAAFHLVVGAG